MANPSSSILQQAGLQAAVKYGPAVSQLAALLGQAQGDLSSGIAHSRGAYHDILQQAAQAGPAEQQAYGQAGQTVDQTHQEVAGNLAPLGGSADPFRAAIERDVQDSHGRLAGALAQAQSALAQYKTNAAAAQAYNVNALQRNYQVSAGQIAQKALELAAQRGDFTQAQADQLQQQADARAQQFALAKAGQQSQSDIAAAHDQNARAIAGVDATGQPLPGRNAPGSRAGSGRAPRPTSGLGSLSQGKENSLAGQLDQAVSFAKTVLSQGGTVADAQRNLTQGVRPGTKDSKGVAVLPVPAFKDQPIVQGAIEIAQYGHLSPQSMDGLHRMGLHVPTRYRPPAPASPQTIAQNVIGRIGVPGGA